MEMGLEIKNSGSWKNGNK